MKLSSARRSLSAFHYAAALSPAAFLNRPPAGVLALSLFFAFGTTMSLLAALALLFPSSALQAVWRLNPQAHTGLAALGSWAIGLMLLVSIACALASVGLWRGAAWGRAIALIVLIANLLGDTGNALFRGDLRTLVGVPIGAALIAYLLLNRRIRTYFGRRSLSAFR
jgi:hypothetical protein